MENSSKSAKLNLKGISIITGTILAVGIGAFAYYNYSGTPKKISFDAPPGININYSTYKGSITGDVVCQIPGAYSLTDPAKDTTGDKKDVQEGIHIYHSDSDIKVQDVLNKIDGQPGNKILIAYYQSSPDPQGKFSIYPADAATKMNALELKLSDTIPANEGISIFSCKKTNIYGLKTETESGSDLPTILTADYIPTSGWVLMAAPTPKSDEKDFKDSLGKAKAKTDKKLKSVWPQKGTDFNFGDDKTQPQSADTATLDTTYKMVWVELGASEVAQQSKTYNVVTNIDAALSSDKKSILLNWTKPDTTEAVSYIVTSYDKNGVKITDNPLTDNLYKFTDVVAGMSYRFAVVAVYPSDGGKSDAVSSSVVDVPTGQNIKPVTDLVANLAADNKSITLNWTKADTTESVTYSIVEHAGYSTLPAVTSTANTLTISNVEAGKSYYFTVTTVYLDGSVSADVTSKPIDVPGSTTVEGVTKVSATLGKDNASADIAWTAVSKPNLVIYTVFKYDDQGNKIGDGFGCQIGSCNIPGLEAGKSYYFTVVTEYPNSTKSDEVKSNTISIPTESKLVDATPSAPSTPTFSNQADNSVDVNWNQPAANFDALNGYFRISWQADGCTNGTGLQSYVAKAADVLTGLVGKYTLGYLSPGTTYGIYLEASNDNSKWSAQSPCAATTTTGALAQLDAPATFTATDATDTSVVLNWTPPAGVSASAIKSYTIKYPDPANPQTLITISPSPTGTDTSLTLTGLKPKTNYFFVIDAMNKSGVEGTVRSALGTTKASTLVEIINNYTVLSDNSYGACSSSNGGCKPNEICVEIFINQHICKPSADTFMYQCNASFTCSDSYTCFDNYKCAGTASCLDSNGKEVGKPAGTGYVCNGKYKCTQGLSCDNADSMGGCSVGTKTCSQ